MSLYIACHNYLSYRENNVKKTGQKKAHLAWASQPIGQVYGLANGVVKDDRPLHIGYLNMT